MGSVSSVDTLSTYGLPEIIALWRFLFGGARFFHWRCYYLYQRQIRQEKEQQMVLSLSKANKAGGRAEVEEA